MKRFLKVAFITCIIALIGFNVFVNVQNYKAVTTLIQNQGMFLSLQNYFNELNADRNRILEDKMEETKVVKVTKPSFEELKSVTVRMLNIIDPATGKGSVGTGTIVKVTEDYTYVLTNRHVAPMDAQHIYIQKDGKRYKGRVLKNGVTRDLSLVRMVGQIPNTSVVKGFRKVNEQDKIYSVGMYFGFQDIYAEGTVAGWTPNGSRLINMPSLYGCSGSGIFDSEGYLVAVLYAGTAYSPFGMDTAKAWCVPYIGIMAFLEEIL